MDRITEDMVQKEQMSRGASVTKLKQKQWKSIQQMQQQIPIILKGRSLPELVRYGNGSRKVDHS